MASFEHEELLRFDDQNAFKAWLHKHHMRTEAVWIHFAKKGKGVKSINYAEALEVALTWGWIDGVAGRIDEVFYKQRFTPRGPKSIWSKVNRDKAMALIESGQMQPRGLHEVERAKADGRWERAYDSPKNAAPGADFEAALSANPKAKAFFAALDAQNRFAYLHRVNITVKPETRSKKIALFVEMLARHEKFYMRDPETKKLVAIKKAAPVEAKTATKKKAAAKKATAEPKRKSP